MLDRLDNAIKAVCPIHGVSGQQGAVRIDFRPEATGQQRAAAQAVLDAFDWSQAADDDWREDLKPERKGLRQAAAAAVADLDAFLGLASPTNAQTLAIVRKLCQQSKAIIKRLIQLD
jgi:DNA mismatch repair ATPase MutS